MTHERISRGEMKVAQVLDGLLENEVAPGTGIEPAQFWGALESICAEMGPKIREALAERDRLQAAIDGKYRTGGPGAVDRAFLEELGYLVFCMASGYCFSSC